MDKVSQIKNVNDFTLSLPQKKINLFFCDVSIALVSSLYISRVFYVTLSHLLILMFSQLALHPVRREKYNAGSWLPAATSATTYAPLAGGVMGQAGSQIRGRQGPSEGAHAGTDLEDSPSDRRSSSRGFLRGCWYAGSTRWSFLFFFMVVKTHDTTQILRLPLVF